MKRAIRLHRKFYIPVVLAFLFSGCMKDKVTKTYKVSTPIYEVLTSFRESVRSQSPEAVINSGKLTVIGKYIFLSEPEKGIHIIDNSDPSSPKNVSFINIPGNEDMAIKGNTLYADAYGDLVSFDISDPLNVKAMQFTANVFPDHSNYYLGNYIPGGIINPDSVNVIIGWSTHDTTVDYDPGNFLIYPGGFMIPNCAYCANMAANTVPINNSNPVGTNGSMARFSIVDNYLYAVGFSNLISFDISQPFSPQYKSTLQVDFHVETIYPLKDKLFVGTNNGMYMYDIIANPGNPSLAGQFTHVRGCDPVIADEQYAYVTINDSSACLGFNNELQIVDISNLQNAFLVKAYTLTHPVGLSKDGTSLFVCDAKGGLKVYNASDANNLQLIKQLNDGVVYDVVAQNGLAIVVAADGVYQYDYADLGNIHLISKF
jgi:hypothetical protein